MYYMINVDLKTKNVNGRVAGCQSREHRAYGLHFDLTIHELGKYHQAGGAHHSPNWDNNNGKGYTLQEVVKKIQAIQATHSDAYPRRCRKCSGVKAEKGYWD